MKWDPFSPELPIEALFITPKLKTFIWRIEHSQVREGGFALMGDPGTGKSVVLRLLAQRLEQWRGVTVGVLTHPQSNLADFYREMGDVFGVGLKPNNRWGSRCCANAGRLISRTRSCDLSCSSTKPRR